MAELHFGALVTDDADVRAERLRRLTLIEHLYTPLPVDGAVARTPTAASRPRSPREADSLGRGSWTSSLPRLLTHTTPR